MSLDHAAKFFGEVQAAMFEHEAAWAAHLAESRRWQEGRGRVSREASQAARARLRGENGGRILAESQEAATEAAADYERTVPRPRWHDNGRPSVNLEYVTDDEVGARNGVVARVVSRLRGAAEVPL